MMKTVVVYHRFENDNQVYKNAKRTKKVCYYVENLSSTTWSALNIKLGFVKKKKTAGFFKLMKRIINETIKMQQEKNL